MIDYPLGEEEIMALSVGLNAVSHGLRNDSLLLAPTTLNVNGKEVPVTAVFVQMIDGSQTLACFVPQEEFMNDWVQKMNEGEIEVTMYSIKTAVRNLQ